MFSAYEYFMGWLFYLAACVGLLIVWWRITAFIKFRIPRDIIRLIAAILLLCPFPVGDESGMLAPAFIMSLFEALFIAGEGFARAGIPVIISTVFVLILYAALSVGWETFVKMRAVKKEQDAVEQDAHDELVEESNEVAS